MRHHRSGKKLGRDSAHRKALYSNLTGSLIEHGRIKTTVAKAKAVRPIAEKMITLGRRGDLAARRQALAYLRSNDIVHILFAEVAPRFTDRPGGYTRITKVGPRAGDAAEMAYLEFVDYVPPAPVARPVREPEEQAVAHGVETRLKLTLEYDGTGFRGWAGQPGLRTVEGEVRRALDIVFPAWSELVVAGRTDTGVHALANVASVEVDGGRRPTVWPRR